jgi:endonuclease/exonuclease/phosphatase (EEP) superfamily protein YafD
VFDGTKQPAQPKLTIWGLLEVLSMAVCAATAARFLGSFWWLFELTTHFPVMLAVTLVLLAIAWSIGRRWKLAATCAAFGLLNGILVFSQGTLLDNQPSITGARLRFTSINVLTSNERSDLVLQYLRDTDPDVILLMEVSHRWLEDLKPLETNYPHFVSRSREDNFGIALFSRIPLTNTSIVQLGEATVPSILTDLVLSNQTVHLVGTHPLPPGTANMSWLRNDQLRNLATHVRKQTGHVILLGDLNTTPWSPHFQQLLRDSHLRNTARHQDALGTWPAWSPLRIPLDHCLVSPAIRVLDRQVGPDVKSDHLPVLADLWIPMGTK